MSITLLLMAALSADRGNDAFQFRGADQSAAYDVVLPTQWGETNNVLWQIPNPGEGWSAPVIADGRLFLTSAVVKSGPQQGQGESDRRGYDGPDMSQADYRWEVRCLDAATGETLWVQNVREGKPTIPRHNTNTYATETPVTDGKYVAAYFGMNGLYCFTVDGKPVWEKDLGVFDMRADWGTASSPALHDGTIYLQIDNEEQSFLTAIDLATGKDLWRVDRDDPSQYSTPYVWKNKQRTEIICVGRHVISYDPATGAELWRISLNKGRSSASPTSDGDVLYVGNELRNRGGDDDGGGFLLAVKAGGEGDITPPGISGDGSLTNEYVKWGVADAGVAMASPVLSEGFLYVPERRSGVIHCYDAATGEKKYAKRLPGARAFWASPFVAGGLVYCLDDTGTTHVVKPGPELEVVERNELPQQFWATPAVSEGRIFLRGAVTLFCIGETN